MKRRQFISTTIAAGGLVLSPSFRLFSLSQVYTRNQLIGKGNPDLRGESYLTTMHKDTAIALQKMRGAASQEGIELEIVSAYRSFQRQKEIFERKYRDFRSKGIEPEKAIEKIIEYSTIPGTSRHHWGTDLDLIDGNAPRPKNVLQAANFHGQGPFCKMKEWMNAHAKEFGFYEVYTDEPTRKGFKYEPWHFSYAPVSVPMLKEYASLDVKAILSEEKVLGNEYFSDAFIKKYRAENIFDINPLLK